MCNDFYMFATLCSHSPNKLNFLRWPLSFFPLSFLIVPSSDKKKNLGTAAEGEGKEKSEQDYIDSTDRESCDLLFWNSLVWKADSISCFSGFHKQPQLSESHGALCLLPFISHPSLMALNHKERSAFISLFAVSASVVTSAWIWMGIAIKLVT